MRKILVLGAGRSSASLVKYFAEHSGEQNWEITLADHTLAQAVERAGNFESVHPMELNAQDAATRSELIGSHDIVVSLLPPNLHIEAAHDCLKFKKSLVTASYTSPAMKALHGEAMRLGITLLNEIGLDPGIDHLSAMEMLDRIRAEGGEIVSFKSYCGGLVAPEFENNPWKYKFTWNPTNVVLAGQATAKYKENGLLHFIPPSRIFEQTELISHPVLGEFEAYANRDSLEYIEPYGLSGARTVLRGTLRKKGYCSAWNCLVKLGYTDNTHKIDNKGLTYADLTSALLPPGKNGEDLHDRLSNFLGLPKTDQRIKSLEWIGLLEEIPLPEAESTPAEYLLDRLQLKWKLEPDEKDMIVMIHEIVYRKNGTLNTEKCSLVVLGDDNMYTAMAKTVGLPLAMSAKHILNGDYKRTGTQIPTTPDLYRPLLSELENEGIRFTHF